MKPKNFSRARRSYTCRNEHSPVTLPQTKRLTPYEVALHTDRLLRTLARESVCIDRLLGKGLVRLAAMDGFAALGYSCLENYASQALGMSGRSAQEVTWMERRLRRYPAIDLAYGRGELTFSHVLRLLRQVAPEDELLWAVVASRLSVAELEEALEHWKAGENAAPGEAEEAGGHPLRAPQDEGRPRRIVGHGHPAVLIKLDPDAASDWGGGVPGESLPWRVPRPGSLKAMWREIELGLAEFTRHWALLNWEVPDLPIPDRVPEDLKAPALDEHLRGIVRWTRQREVHLMDLLGILVDDQLLTLLDFTGVEHYAADRLAMSPRSAWTLVTLHRRLRNLSAVRRAYEDGTLSKAQAILVGQVATERSQKALELRRFDLAGFERTWGLPDDAAAKGGLQAFAAGRPQQSESKDTDDLQACAEGDEPTRRASDVIRKPVRERLRMFRRGELDQIEPEPRLPIRFGLPEDLVEMWCDVYRVCRAMFGPTVTIADCVEVCVDAFLKQWAPAALQSIREHQVIDRDGWICANPTCTRRANLHVHPMEFRAPGGPEEPWNEVSLRRMCDLRLVHGGRIRVRGRAPEQVTWLLGVAPDRAPHLQVAGRRIVGGMAA